MAKSLSEEFKDQKINDLLEDYISLGKEINNIPERLKLSLNDLKVAIEKLPDGLESGINKLVDAVEEAEKSFDTMANTHRSILLNQLDESKLEVRKYVSSALDEGLRDAHQQLNQLSRKAESINKESTMINNKSWIAVIVMGLVTFFSISAVVLMAVTK